MCQSLTGYSQARKAPVKKTVTAKKIIKKPVVKKAPGKISQPVRIKIITDSGTMIVKLYDSTPLHRDNFVKLVKEGFYDSLLFHRVIPQFMIQGGDPGSKHAEAGSLLGAGGDELGRIPAEFRKTLFHKKGALAAARDQNPEKASSACQFYIVVGKTYTDEQLKMMQEQRGIYFSPAQIQTYKTVGGTPFLDQDYTVFGEVEKGLDVIEKIANAARDENNRPLTDIRMHMEIIPAAKK
ncbi:MAG: peptidylprolyl isomerase [Bacteroidetes bacterium]|nr:peptidylprolyl isomerase [Bacteroidota bacterium]